VPECAKTAQKTYFLVALDDFFLKNRLIDIVRGLFSSLNIGTYLLLTYLLLFNFLGPFGGTQMPQNSIKKHFLIVPDYFSCKKEPNDFVRGPF
jgi:hypothetical protein